MIKGVLFDKDGTLIDFNSLWIGAAIWSIDEIIRLNNLPIKLQQYLLQTIGVVKGKITVDAPLAYKTYKEIAKDIVESLAKVNIHLATETMAKQLMFFFEQFILLKKGEYKEVADTKEIIKELKKEGIVVGLSTADTKELAIDCLTKLDVLNEFDYIGSDDGIISSKPNPEMIHDFMRKYSLSADEIVVVGDTYNDILFAKRGGAIAVGVLSGVSKREDFRGEADFIIESIAEISSIVKCKELEQIMIM